MMTLSGVAWNYDMDSSINSAISYRGHIAYSVSDQSSKRLYIYICVSKGKSAIHILPKTLTYVQETKFNDIVQFSLLTCRLIFSLPHSRGFQMIFASAEEKHGT
jgi:hypothetical protein